EYWPTLFAATVKATVAEEPDCSVGIRQTTELLFGALQVPPVAVPMTNVAPVVTVPVTVILVAGSGPSLATVNVTVTWLPALTVPAVDMIGATQVMHKSVAVPNWVMNALLVAPGVSVFWSGLKVAKLTV